MALVFLMAVSLSMDAFSLALVYGTLGMSKKYKIFLSIIVGMYHFVMPLLGMFLGEVIWITSGARKKRRTGKHFRIFISKFLI